MSRSNIIADCWFALAAVILTVVAAVPAAAQSPSPAVIKQFDTDGDGKLSEAEREAVRKATIERLGGPEEVLKRFDKNGDGKLDDEERSQIRQRLSRQGNTASPAKAAKGKRPEGGAMLDRAAMFRSFDANGDGKLDDAERAKLMAAMRSGAAGNRPRPNGPAMPRDGDPPAAKPPGRRAALEQLPPEIQQRLLQRFDENRNGKLDPEEFQKIQAQRERMGGGRANASNLGLTGGAPPTPTLDQTLLLKQFDANGNHRLDASELAAAARSLPPTRRP